MRVPRRVKGSARRTHNEDTKGTVTQRITKSFGMGPFRYCCFGTFHVKTMSFFICLIHYALLWYAWYLLLVDAYWFQRHQNTAVQPASFTFLTLIIIAFTIVTIAMIAIKNENHILLLPIITFKTTSLLYTAYAAICSIYFHTEDAKELIWIECIHWLASLGVLLWGISILISCFLVFRYDRNKSAEFDKIRASSLWRLDFYSVKSTVPSADQKSEVEDCCK
uniref:Uncharacterized protein n=1 Tax=Plectus sambesii TaxID=2011161 RepID=A0A914WWW6_9BILA